jgi:hypothetical protein
MISHVRDILAMVPGLEIAEEDFGDGEDIMDMLLPDCRCPRCAERRVAAKRGSGPFWVA